MQNAAAELEKTLAIKGPIIKSVDATLRWEIECRTAVYGPKFTLRLRRAFYRGVVAVLELAA